MRRGNEGATGDGWGNAKAESNMDLREKRRKREEREMEKKRKGTKG